MPRFTVADGFLQLRAQLRLVRELVRDSLLRIRPGSAGP